MAPFNDVSVHIMSAPLHCYTNKPGSEFGNSGVTVKLKWCHNVMVEAEDHLWLLLTSILDIYIVLWHLLMISVCILWMHPYSVTPPRRGQIFGNSGWLSSESDVMAHDHHVMVEAVNHIWLLFDTSLSDIYIVLCHLLMMSVCILRVHPYTVTPTNLDQI